eukprot:scaffold463639_cov31-Prasinocladus_malaysianus.AAC.1
MQCSGEAVAEGAANTQRQDDAVQGEHAAGKAWPVQSCPGCCQAAADCHPPAGCAETGKKS